MRANMLNIVALIGLIAAISVSGFPSGADYGHSLKQRRSLLDSVQDTLGEITDETGNLLNELGQEVGDVTNQLGSNANSILSKVRRSAEKEHDTVGDTVSDAVDGVNGILDTLKGELGNVVDQAENLVHVKITRRSADPGLLKDVGDVVDGAVGTVENTVGGVVNKAEGLVNGVLSSLQRRSAGNEHPSLLKDLEDVVDGVVGTVENTVEGVVNKAEGLVNGVSSTLKRRSAGNEHPSLLKDLEDVVDGVVGTVENTVEGVVNKAEGLVDGVSSTLKRRRSASIEEKVGGILSAAGQTVKNTMGDVEGSLDTVVGELRRRRESGARKSRQNPPTATANITRKARSADDTEERSEPQSTDAGTNPHQRHIAGRVRNETLRAAIDAAETDSPAAPSRRRRTFDFSGELEAFKQQVQTLANQLQDNISSFINEIMPGSSTSTLTTSNAAPSIFTGSSSAPRTKRQDITTTNPINGSATIKGSERHRRSVDGVEEKIRNLLNTAANLSTDELKTELETFITETFGSMTGEEAIATGVKISYEIMSLPLEDIAQLVTKAISIASDEIGMDVSKMLNDSFHEAIDGISKNGL